MKLLIPDPAGKRVILGLSGGVDSAVAALLLKDQGADVHALHMTNWDDDDGYCTAAADLQDARDVCEQLQIPLHHVNFAREYRDRVFQYFLEEYKAGRTPNPDVLCNREIKFGVFRTYAHRLGGALLATGHYARAGSLNGAVKLFKAADLSKDQSYFLHAVSAEALAETIFPLGELQKHEVRTLAHDRGLLVHDKKDSTGICFIGERPFREFLATYLPASPGPMRTPDGRDVGQHQGLMYYTIGQRQGLGLGGRQDATDEPWYVAAKDLADNALIVVQGDHELMYSDGIEIGDTHWIGPALAAGEALSCKCKIRYRQDDQDCTLKVLDSARIEIAFGEPQRAVAPGQFAVFYDGDCCLGGGVIERTLSRSGSGQSIMRPRADTAHQYS
jgi:tRNA-specific 2-thiouridylase